MEATVGIEPAIKVLQTSALPLGYVALNEDYYNLPDFNIFFKVIKNPAFFDRAQNYSPYLFRLVLCFLVILDISG